MIQEKTGMCRKYHMQGEALTLAQVIDRIHSRPHLPPKIVYSQQEIVSASKVLERLAARTRLPVATNG
jgi:hypothetical protein